MTPAWAPTAPGAVGASLAVPGRLGLRDLARLIAATREARAVAAIAGGLLVAVVASGAIWDGFFEDAINGLDSTMAKFYEAAFSAGTVGAAEWNIATGFASKAGAVAGIIACGLAAVGVVKGVIAGSIGRVLTATLLLMLAWPITATAIWATIWVTAQSDVLATLILGDVSGVGAANGATLVAIGGAAVLVVTGGGMAGVLIMLIPVIGAVLLALVMAFRAFALVVAVGFSPSALMMVGFDAARPMIGTWAKMVIGLILTKPLAAGIITISSQLVSGGGGVAEFLMGLVGVWVAVFSPGLSIGLVGFMGAQVGDAAAAHIGGGVGRTASMMFGNAIASKLGSLFAPKTGAEDGGGDGVGDTDNTTPTPADGNGNAPTSAPGGGLHTASPSNHSASGAGSDSPGTDIADQPGNDEQDSGPQAAPGADEAVGGQGQLDLHTPSTNDGHGDTPSAATTPPEHPDGVGEGADQPALEPANDTVGQPAPDTAAGEGVGQPAPVPANDTAGEPTANHPAGGQGPDGAAGHDTTTAPGSGQVMAEDQTTGTSPAGTWGGDGPRTADSGGQTPATTGRHMATSPDGGLQADPAPVPAAGGAGGVGGPVSANASSGPGDTTSGSRPGGLHTAGGSTGGGDGQ